MKLFNIGKTYIVLIITVLVLNFSVVAQEKRSVNDFINTTIGEDSFENSENWSLDIISGGINWAIAEKSSNVVNELLQVQNNRSTWTNNVAYFSALSVFNQDSVQDMEATLTWVGENINLTDFSRVAISWHQSYVASNFEKLYFEYSTNGIDWNIYKSEELYPDLQANETAEEFVELALSEELGNMSNVSIRFRWEYKKANNTLNFAGAGLGWVIDDLKIIADCNYIVVNDSITNASTSSSNDGSIILEISDSAFYGNMVIGWSTGADTNSITNLEVGTYTVTITDDSTHCHYYNSYEITDNCNLTLAIDTIIFASGMNTSDGAVAVTVQGAVGYINYIWNNNNTNDSLINVQTGVYSLTVTDSLGCIRDLPYIYVENNCSIKLEYTTKQGDDSDTITIVSSNGQSPYSYLWSNADTTETINVSRGQYSVTVTDAYGCQAIKSNINTCIIATDFSIVQPTGADSTDGSISVSVSNTIGTVNYMWSTNSTNDTIKNLSQGIYYVDISDSSSCSVHKIIYLSADTNCNLQIVPTIVNPTWNNGAMNNGSIEITMLNGTNPYTYLWSNGERTAKIENLRPQQLYLSVYDANYCVAYWNTKIVSGIYDIKLQTSCKIYPNPSRGTIFIENANNSNLRIYNSLGVKIDEFRVYDTQKKINLSQGVYIFIIEEAGKIFNKKIIVE